MKIMKGYTTVIIMLLFVCVVGTTLAQQKRHIIIPNGTSHVLDMGMMSTNASLFDTDLWVHNPTDQTLYYTLGNSFGHGGGYLSFYSDPDAQLPDGVITVTPHDSTHLFFYAQGAADDPIDADMDVYYSESPYFDYTEPSEPLHFTIRVKQRNDDLVDIFPDQFAFSDLNDQWPISKDILINNNIDPVTIYSIFSLRGSHYTIAGISSPLPATVQKGETFTIYLSYGAPDTTYLTDGGDTSYADLVFFITQPGHDPVSASYADRPAKQANLASVPKISMKNAPLLQAYPNPASQEITIRYSIADGSPAKILLYDMGGKLCMSQDLFPGNSETRLDVAGLAGGMYVVGIVSGAGRESQLVEIIH